MTEQNSQANVHPRFGTPVVALVTQGVIASIFALLGTYDQLITCIVFAGFVFYALSAAAVIRLRTVAPDLPRPYRTWGYPVTPIIFCILILASISYLVYDDYLATFVRHDQKAMWMSIMSAGTLLVGGAVYFANKLIKKK